MNTYPDDCVEASDWKQVNRAEDQYKFHPMNHYSFNADYREVAKRMSHNNNYQKLWLECLKLLKWPWC